MVQSMSGLLKGGVRVGPRRSRLKRVRGTREHIVEEEMGGIGVVEGECQEV